MKAYYIDLFTNKW